MKKTPKEFLCQKCLKKMQEYDRVRKFVWREENKRSQKVNIKIKK